MFSNTRRRPLREGRKDVNKTLTLMSSRIKFPLPSLPKGTSVQLSTSNQSLSLLTFERTVIIGSGVAASSAAATLSASALPNCKPLVIAGPLFGGQLSSAQTLINWPGVIRPTTGQELLSSMHLHASLLGARVLATSVKLVNTEMWPYHIFTQNGRVIVANSIILATGRQRIGLNLPGEASLLERGVYLKFPLSINPFKGKNVIVIGTSRTAAWEALQLALAARRVTVVCRKAKFSCGQDLQTTLKRSNVNILLNVKSVAYATRDVNQFPTLCGLEVSHLGVSLSLQADAVFLATNITARTDMVQRLAVSSRGYVKTKHPIHTETNLPGLFVAGDIIKGNNKHAIMAAASGFAAALAVQRFLSSPPSSTLTTFTVNVRIFPNFRKGGIVRLRRSSQF
ncbi:MAG: NAD(P)/FAD-dependent oxidoreductase [Candidatus Hodgkinia cicadicola]